MSNNEEDRVGWILHVIARELAAREAMRFVDCRKKGGSLEECMGIYRAAPFLPPGCPHFEELLSKLPEKERQQALVFIKQALLEHVKAIDKRLESR